MKSSEVVKMNDIEPIGYFNPDSLCKNNFKYWRRLTMNEPKWGEMNNGQKMDFGFTAGISGIINDLPYTNTRPSGKGGIRSDSVYDKNGIIRYIRDSKYEIEHHFEHLYYSGQLHINSLDDFTTVMLDTLKKVVVEEPNSKKWPWDTHHEKVEKYILNGLKHYELKRILKRSFTYLSHVYEKEGEWYITGKSLKVPKGSILYIKEDPPEDKPRVPIGFSSRGMKGEVIDKIVNDYGLDRIYDIRRVENHLEMMEILKTEFSNVNQQSNSQLKL